ncbi:pantetheine-phosphate adenylyltransferase [candidate division KSB1 bacterium]|nr:pantetheine-phosphate adenylyltransferase [candidate division KSB1 bacterium]NIR71353.1 pantetheine-phosphate adenylyltransferase [candidate division KSB1 bacterium]NIS26243.1 pantetheine-phosphate adenylyltransferase [candidate division KSB1 bacterium]NIT74673.1 pantetheine-phosphate adenylyltransferase [candidate division KSB1 bacterium]NIU26891.1 pantetheine-phosphate adenylyltransferase [candidate division KSB1 bacterium]
MPKEKKLAIYPGTFDPITNGHLDIIQRAVSLFESVIVAVTTNPSKAPLFTVSERVNMIEEATSKLENVTVENFSGLLMHYAEKRNADVIVRGLRAITDFEYEFQMALVNRKLAGDIVTVFLMPNEKYTYLNSTIVKEVAKFDGDVSSFVPQNVHENLIDRFKNE